MRPTTARKSTGSSDRFSQRRDRLCRTLTKKRLSALLVTDPTNVHYLSGFRGEDSWLLVSPSGSVILSDSRFTVQIEEECPGLDVEIRSTGQTLVSLTKKLVEGTKSTNLGFESHALTFHTYSTLADELSTVELAPTAELVEDLRVIKDREEIETLRQAVSTAERAFAILRATLQPTDSEWDLANRLEATIRSLGGQQSAFDPICATGTRAALPHAIPTEHTCGESSLLLVDWGARWDMYNSDLTRVLVFGKMTAKFEKVYNVVLKAQRAAIDAIRPGITGGEVDRIARRTIEDAGYGRYFGHSLGHGLGLRVHEAPGLRPGGDAVLRTGMVVTVEPGIYLKDWGGVRIEDDILVTKSGHEVLTSVPKELDDVCLDY